MLSDSLLAAFAELGIKPEHKDGLYSFEYEYVPMMLAFGLEDGRPYYFVAAQVYDPLDDAMDQDMFDIALDVVQGFHQVDGDWNDGGPYISTRPVWLDGDVVPADELKAQIDECSQAFAFMEANICLVNESFNQPDNTEQP